jgi:hypothetical protein
MVRRHWSVGVGLVFVVGLLTAMIVSAVRLPIAFAQERTRQASAPRFQIAAWAYPATLNGSNSDQKQFASFGAYIVDTQDGRVWRSEGQNGGVTLIGQCK